MVRDLKKWRTGGYSHTRCINCFNLVRKEGDWTQVRCVARQYADGKYVPAKEVYKNKGEIFGQCGYYEPVGYWKEELYPWMLELEV